MLISKIGEGGVFVLPLPSCAARVESLVVIACTASAEAGVHTVQAAVAILIMVDTATSFVDLSM